MGGVYFSCCRGYVADNAFELDDELAYVVVLCVDEEIIDFSSPRTAAFTPTRVTC